MLILAINTASSNTGIALLDDGKLLSEKSWKSQNNEAEMLMPEIKELLGETGFEQIKKVIVVRGPGSFTGLRVGITVANTIAYLNKCELNAVDSFEYMWTSQEELQSGFALLLYAGSGGVYVSKKPGEIGEIVNMPDLNDYLQDHNIIKVFGDISEEQKNQLENIEFIETDTSFGKIIEKVLHMDHPSVEIVTPLYVKKPAITKSKKSIF